MVNRENALMGAYLICRSGRFAAQGAIQTWRAERRRQLLVIPFLLVVALGFRLAHPCGAETATAAGKNFLPDAGFDRFEGDLPQGWTATIWN